MITGLGSLELEVKTGQNGTKIVFSRKINIDDQRVANNPPGALYGFRRILLNV